MSLIRADTEIVKKQYVYIPIGTGRTVFMPGTSGSTVNCDAFFWEGGGTYLQCLCVKFIFDACKASIASQPSVSNSINSSKSFVIEGEGPYSVQVTWVKKLFLNSIQNSNYGILLISKE